jgi:hypothetical protein
MSKYDTPEIPWESALFIETISEPDSLLLAN